MYRELTATVLSIYYEDEDIQKLETDKGANKAILYKRLCPRTDVGDQVIVNVTATDLLLGTGGWDFVVSHRNKVLHWTTENDGHIMKARYTPIQHSVQTVESQESEYHHLFEQPFSLEGRPIWIAELHSMVPLFFALLQVYDPKKRLCVIIDDQASLPLYLSDQIREMKKNPNLITITVGQAFGGDFEAITIASAIQFAYHILKVDCILISVGPGVVGSGSYYGFTGMIQAHWSHIISGLGGQPVWIPRISFFDKRNRHYGLSHHTLTTLCEFTFKPAFVPFPVMEQTKLKRIKQQLFEREPHACSHRFIFSTVAVANWVTEALNWTSLPIYSMGRTFEEDPLFFCAVAEALRFGLEQ
ncbi:DUF3866 family protein [Bacillus sp. JCM 19034]|uniref:DUF3866 family protein n=1 Tax=Bacillus sp. JCM 19034 TaxID=1481928 RepID=UPI0007803CB6|nr:DUF3866 family protein [Bacillus sp. JCM 19034]